MTYYLYKTTCLENGKYYYGVHSEKRPNDGYIGCGVCSDGTAINLKRKGVKSYFVDSVVKYGYKKFKKQIIAFFDSIDDAFEVEELIVDENEVNNKNCMNIKLGGKGGLNISTCKEISILDTETNEEFSFISQSECANFLGLKNISGKKRFCNNRYVVKDCAEPISLKNIKGEIFSFVDIYQAKKVLGLTMHRLRDLMNGKRNSANGYFISNFDFTSNNWQGVKKYKRKV